MANLWNTLHIFGFGTVQAISDTQNVQAPISISDLRRIIEFFPFPGFEFKLDPSFEPEMKGRDEGMITPNIENTRIFGLLQKYNRLNLLIY